MYGMTQTTTPPYKALRDVTELSQREVERRLGWDKRGHLSLIERGVPPTPEQRRDLIRFYTGWLAEQLREEEA
jgi:transcriptional regulator with XRE-family HTH domain